MAGESPLERPVPPPSEQVHLPEPTYLPVVVGFGVTLAIAGIVLSFIITGIGLLITVIAVAIWIRDTRSDIAELPLEH